MSGRRVRVDRGWSGLADRLISRGRPISRRTLQRWRGRAGAPQEPDAAAWLAWAKSQAIDLRELGTGDGMDAEIEAAEQAAATGAAARDLTDEQLRDLLPVRDESGVLYTDQQRKARADALASEERAIVARQERLRSERELLDRVSVRALVRALGQHVVRHMEDLPADLAPVLDALTAGQRRQVREGLARAILARRQRLARQAGGLLRQLFAGDDEG